jgi:hypothetical protein
LFSNCEQLALDGNPYTAWLAHRAPDFALSLEQSSQFGLSFHDAIYLAFPGRSRIMHCSDVLQQPNARGVVGAFRCAC